jgi:RNA polymerase sigma-70 factor, ECF subfamily
VGSSGGSSVTNFPGARVYLPTDEDDAALVARCLEGDPDAFAGLVGRYQRVLYTVALRMLGNPADAEDAAQTAFVRAFERLGSYDGQHRFFSWMYRILANECLNQIRARKPLELVADRPSDDALPPEVMEAAERQRVVQQALLLLSSEHREVIVLRHFAELGYDEIGAALGIPVKTVKSRLYTARQQLAGRLRNLGWTT